MCLKVVKFVLPCLLFFLSIFFLMMNIVIIVTLFARQKTNVFLTKQKGVIYEKSILY
nr:MAG TPA: hypothetical protein [Inoviridae sp.]